jgi:CHASE2 domain-containing sensor protein
LIGLEFGTATAAVVGGLLLAARPDGALLQAPVVALAGSPFHDWRLPGLLLATLVGGGFSAAGTRQWRRGRHARELSVLAGLGLVCFELAELAWIGFQPLQALFMLVGVTVCVLARRTGGHR